MEIFILKPLFVGKLSLFFSDVKWCFNPCPAELLQLYFLSFEAGIANAISSNIGEKYYHLWKIDMSKIKLLDQLSIY